MKRRGAGPALCWLLLATLLAGTGCGPGVSPRGPQPVPMSADARNRAAQSDLQTARKLQASGRLEPAIRAVERGLAREPDDPKLRAKLHRLAAEMLQHRYSRYDLAARHRARAEELDPPDPPPPDTPIDADASGLLIVLLPPTAADARPRTADRPNALADWPDGVVAQTLATRLETRLRGVRVVVIAAEEHPTSESIAAARAWVAPRDASAILTLRPVRTYCGETGRDGRFSVVWLRVAAGVPQAAPPSPEVLRFVRDASQSPEDRTGCEGDALAHAVETLLQRPVLEDLLAELPAANGADASAALPGPAWLELFPTLRQRVVEKVEEGRVLFQNGRLEDARERFAEALAIDPDDADALVFVAEIDSTLAIAAQLDDRSGRSATGSLDPHLSEAQQQRLAAELALQQRQREELLAALAVVEGEPNLPAALDVAALEPASIDPQSLGARLARRGTEDAVEGRNLRGPDGDLIARYFVAAGSGAVLLREEDRSGDGQPERFTAYRDRMRSEVWEARGGRVERHVFYANDGVTVERIDIDSNADGQVDRLLRYREGTLASEFRDSNGDAQLDTTDQFDASGQLVQRDEDRDADGEVDVRSHYENGRLVRREVLDPSMARGMRRGQAR